MVRQARACRLSQGLMIFVYKHWVARRAMCACRDLIAESGSRASPSPRRCHLSSAVECGLRGPTVRVYSVLAALQDTPGSAMIKLLQAGAVPFGFTSDMSEGDSPYHCGECSYALRMNWRHDHRSQADGKYRRAERRWRSVVCVTVSTHVRLGPMQVTAADKAWFRLLPDIITSNTPPPSPLPRSRSCLAFFHEKTHSQTSLAAPASSNTLNGSDVDGEARLSHVLEVRRHLHRDAPSTSTAHLPHLTWVLPHVPSFSRSLAKDGEEGRRRGRDEDGEQQRLWRQVGGDLRKMADQFEPTSRAQQVCGWHTSLPCVVETVPRLSLISREDVLGETLPETHVT
ncbi:hypothetical protein E2C01_021876 [Portunus trituberculatus]|uniref:Uncharacterized protein n=1 Tax=Portunus trituberculatus TaxID=210409 RepID=A0A5B7E650_PORTR|nr:hypothetical protein [Portunus trituberculatus]